MEYLNAFVSGVTHALAIFVANLGVLLILLLIAVMVMILRTMPRPSAKRIKPDAKSHVTWDHVAGLAEAKAELAEVVEFLRDPARFAKLGARVPKGVLLYGPPGTGKTLLAKAVAGESGSAFFSVSASSFVEMYSGVGASRIRALFKAARKHAPAIIFIDELDAVGQVRAASGMNREQDQTLNQLLVELDGFETKHDVILIASTNRVDALDPALLRPGRFDRQAFVPPPDLAARIAILKVHTRTKPLGDDVDLTIAARSTAGLSGADLENICNEAAIRAARDHRRSISALDFDDALERVLAGLQTGRTMSDAEKLAVAYHEAGHALLAHLVSRLSAVHKVTIIPRGGALGYNLVLPTAERMLARRDDLISDLIMILGGRAAEQVALGAISNGAADDLRKVTEIARAMVFDWGMGESVTTRTVSADNFGLSEETKRLRDSEQTKLCDEAFDEAVRLISEHREALDRLAERLLERETLDREDILTILHDVTSAQATPTA